MPVKFVFNDLQLAAWMLMHQASNSVVKCEEKLFDTKELTTQQHSVLMAIKNAETPATPTQIADWIDRNVNSVTLIVDRMEKSGLVKRVRDIQDRRSFRVAMTKKGELHLEEGTVRGWQLIQGVLEGFSEEELKTLVALLEKLRRQALNKCCGKKKLKEIIISNRRSSSDLSKGSMSEKRLPRKSRS